jgi:hypothetical protein
MQTEHYGASASAGALNLSASTLVFCRSVTMRPGRRFTASSNAARATPIITGKSDQLFDVRVSVIPEFH